MDYCEGLGEVVALKPVVPIRETQPVILCEVGEFDPIAVYGCRAHKVYKMYFLNTDTVLGREPCNLDLFTGVWFPRPLTDGQDGLSALYLIKPFLPEGEICPYGV